jgi:uroporphyrinogen decarboxylase
MDQKENRMMRQPDFANLLAVLRRDEPGRPTLFEFFMNDTVYDHFTSGETFDHSDGLGECRRRIRAFANAGYDYVTLPGSDFAFPHPEIRRVRSISQNSPGIITDRESLSAYAWPDPERFSCSRLDSLSAELPSGMKIIVYGPSGVLENVTTLLGFETMCLMLREDPDLLGEIFGEVGARLLRYYEMCLGYPAVGAVIINDDWGFFQQTFLSPSDMRRLVFPWHRRIVAAAHQAGRPAILHSCGNLREVWEDVIEDMRFDGKHSFEDKIQPVEEAYEQYGRRIAILGGFDLDFICRSSPEGIRLRVRSMVERTRGRGGFAIGTGNSVPDYVPLENYLAMIEPAGR